MRRNPGSITERNNNAIEKSFNIKQCLDVVLVECRSWICGFQTMIRDVQCTVDELC